MNRHEHQEIEALLLASADQFLASEHTLARTRALRQGPPAPDNGLWPSMAACGWLTMLLPEALGGSGLGVGSAAALAARFGAALLPEPFADCSVAPAAVLAAAAASPTAQALAQALAAGDARPALAWQAAPGELEPSWPVRLSRQQRTAQLHGHAVAVEASATHWIVAAMDAGTPTLCLVEAGSPHTELAPQRRADGSMGIDIGLHGTPVDEACVLLRGDAARSALARGLDDARLVLAAHLAGIAQGALAQTTAYLGQRVQFGQPIARFQAVRHRVVDLELQRRLAFASWQHAAALCGAPPADPAAVGSAISAAKARCADAALATARAAVQLHGAIGYTEEADIGLYLDAALKHAAQLGNASAHRHRVTAIVLSAALDA